MKTVPSSQVHETLGLTNGTSDNLVALLSFTHVASHGGVSAASRATGLPKATLSRHVRQLEASLGLRLIERGTRTVRLTGSGAALQARTAALLMEIADALDTIAGRTDQPRGTLRVSVPVLFAHLAVGRIAADFTARYPEVQLDISAEDRLVDLVAEGYDAVVRIDPRPHPTLVGRCFLRERHLVVASPALMFPTDPTSTSSIPAVVLNGGRDVPTWQLHRESGLIEVKTRPVMRVSSMLMVRDAARAGIGAAVLPRSLVADDLADGCLTMWGAASGREVELWAMHTSRRFVNAKVQAFVDFLCSAFGE